MSSSEKIVLIRRAEEHGARTVIIASDGRYTYNQLLGISRQIGRALLDGKDDLREERVAFLTPRGFHYVALQWGIWRAGGIAVPLCEIHPISELEYVITDSGASTVVSHPEFEDKLRAVARELGVRFVLTEELRTWGKKRLAPYKIPTRVAFVDDFPRNPLGKVKKTLLKKLF